MLGDAPVCRESILFLNIGDVKSPKGGQREPVTWGRHINKRSTLIFLKEKWQQAKHHSEDLVCKKLFTPSCSHTFVMITLVQIHSAYCKTILFLEQTAAWTVGTTCLIMLLPKAWHSFKTWRTPSGHLHHPQTEERQIYCLPPHTAYNSCTSH